MRLIRTAFVFYLIGGALLLEYGVRRSFRLWQMARRGEPATVRTIRQRKRVRRLALIGLGMVVSAIVLLAVWY